MKKFFNFFLFKNILRNLIKSSSNHFDETYLKFNFTTFSFFAVLLFSCVLHNSFAQKTITRQNLAWFAYTLNVELAKKWSWQTELQERFYLNPFAQHQFVTRTHLHRTLGESNWEASAGMCLFLQSPNDPLATNKLIVPELRPHIEMMYRQNFKKWGLEHRYRAEARYFHQLNSSKTELAEGYEFGNFRFRYRLQANIKLVSFEKRGDLRLKIADEIHFNAGSKIVTNVFDQNRIYCDLVYAPTPSLQFEIGYLNWFQQTASGNFFNRNIVRFSMVQRIKRNEKK